MTTEPGVNLLELEALAAARLPDATFGYFAGGAADELALRPAARPARRLHEALDLVGAAGGDPRGRALLLVRKFGAGWTTTARQLGGNALALIAATGRAP